MGENKKLFTLIPFRPLANVHWGDEHDFTFVAVNDEGWPYVVESEEEFIKIRDKAIAKGEPAKMLALYPDNAEYPHEVDSDPEEEGMIDQWIRDHDEKQRRENERIRGVIDEIKEKTGKGVSLWMDGKIHEF